MSNLNENLIKYFSNHEWNIIHIEGSSIGNTSFILNFIENILSNEKEDLLDKIMGSTRSFLYLRSQEIKINKERTLKIVDSIKKESEIEFVMSEDVFNYREVLRALGNKRYTHLVIDEVRKEEFMKDFSEVMNYCERFGVKVIISTANNRSQKLAYSYYDSDLILSVNTIVLENRIVLEIQDLKNNKFHKFNMSM